MGAMANKRKAVGATALHASLKMKGGSAHIVGIGDLRVILSKEDGSWFAQALEIDYFAEGVSLEDVKKRFEDGLVLTIDENLRVFGHIKGVLVPPPRGVLEELVSCQPVRYSQLSRHVFLDEQPHLLPSGFPFQAIQYFERLRQTQVAV